jgi:hypothetical protein
MGRFSNLVIAGIVSMSFATGSAMAFGQPGAGGFSFGLIASSNTFDTSGTEFQNSIIAGRSGQENSTTVSTDADFGSGFIDYTAHPEGSLAAVTLG